MKLTARVLQDGRRLLFASHYFGSSKLVRVTTPKCPSHRHRTKTTAPPQPPPPPIVGPIITFLSPSPTRSRSTVEFLNKLFGLPQIQIYNISSSSESAEIGWKRKQRDCLDELHFGKDASSSSWDSIACACPTSGTILHFLSYRSATAEERWMDHAHSPFHLIAVHGSMTLEHAEPTTSHSHYHTAVIECRRRLAEILENRQVVVGSTVEARLRGLLVYVMCNIMGREPRPNWIIPTSPSTAPILDLGPLLPSNAINVPVQSMEDENRRKRSECTGKLRELVLPYFPAVSSLQSTLSQSSLLRPLPGLYQYPVGAQNGKGTEAERKTNTPPSGLVVRPLPAAQEDLRLSPPSLVFQSKSLDKAQTLVEEKLGGRTSKIGWRGNGQLGSLIVSHPSITGLDVRICETTGDEWVLSRSFDESEHSLLAGSLADLQSAHVVSDGKQGVAAGEKTAAKNGGDCWIEVRKNLQHPAGYLKHFTKSSPLTVAKPPDLPYE